MEVSKPLGEALMLLDARDFGGAAARAKEADSVPNLTPFEDYSIARVEGFIALSQPMPEVAAAAAAYNRQVASGGAPASEATNMYDVAMRLNYARTNYDEVIRDATALRKLRPLDETGYEMLIQSWYNIRDFSDAIAAAKERIAVLESSRKGPPELLLSLLFNAQLAGGDAAGANQTLDQLAVVSSKPEIWSQVLNAAASAGGLTEHELLNVYRLALLTGTMRPGDYDAMAEIDIRDGLPAEAVSVLTAGHRMGDLLARAEKLAMSAKPLPVRLDPAGRGNGQQSAKLGEQYFSVGRYDEAIMLLRQALKESVMDPADTRTTLAIVLLAAGRLEEALKEFREAAGPVSPAGSVAHAWALYAAREKVADAAPKLGK